MDCPICDKIKAFEEYYDFCDICGWQSDPFMNNDVIEIEFHDCNGNKIPTPIEIGGAWSSPNHCNSIADAREAWSKYKTKRHFNKDKAPLTREERIKIRIARRPTVSSGECSKEIMLEYTEEEHDKAFKCFFGIDRKNNNESPPNRLRE
jgi:hypothetical protein